MNTAACKSRSAYVSQLRRAFLLRAHPDRFRSRSESVRRGQAELLQAISNRMTSADFLDYTRPVSGGSMTIPSNGKTSSLPHKKYVLEKKDGTLVHQTLQLSGSVENILQSMSDALKTLGVTPPSPPDALSTKTSNVKTAAARNDHTSAADSTREMHNRVNTFMRSMNHKQQTPRNGGDQNGFNHSSTRENMHEDQINIKSYQGRDLLQFLKNTNISHQVQTRKSYRIDAQAAALVARRAFQFQSIDGTKLRWSSKTLAKYLTSLTNLHEEYAGGFMVDSFYPFRLVLSSPDDRREEMDLYGGFLTLNVASTPNQWLPPLLGVTKESLEVLKCNQDALVQYTRIVSDVLGVKLKRGHTCSSKLYHEFLQHLALETFAATRDTYGEMNDHTFSNVVRSSSDLSHGRISVIVESPEACRRAMVTRDGNIRIGTGFSGEQIISGISKLSPEARQKIEKEEEMQQVCREKIEHVKLVLNVENVNRVPFLPVTTDQFIEGLDRLLVKAGEGDGLDMRSFFVGQSLGIASRGQFCHIGDDGTIVIPFDFH